MVVVDFDLVDCLLYWSTCSILILGVDLDTPDVGVLAVLMILLDVHLDDITAK